MRSELTRSSHVPARFCAAGLGAGVSSGRDLVAQLEAKLAACVGAGADAERASLAAQLVVARAALDKAEAKKSADCACAPARRLGGLARRAAARSQSGDGGAH